MRFLQVYVTRSTLLFAAVSVQAQGNFQNPNIESANSANPSGYYSQGPATNALPDWSASIGGMALTEMGGDGDSAGTASINLAGPNTNADSIGPLNENTSVYQQPYNLNTADATGGSLEARENQAVPGHPATRRAGAGSTAPQLSSRFGKSLKPAAYARQQRIINDAIFLATAVLWYNAAQGKMSLWQTGTISADAQSFDFSAWSYYPAENFAVSSADNSPSPISVSSGEVQHGAQYYVYSAYNATNAGQFGQLKFPGMDNNGVNPDNRELNDIGISVVKVIPEPNTLALLVMGGLALAALRWRKKCS
jgi:hypothetical protein